VFGFAVGFELLDSLVLAFDLGFEFLDAIGECVDLLTDGLDGRCGLIGGGALGGGTASYWKRSNAPRSRVCLSSALLRV
jgi:hypothetical protein